MLILMEMRVLNLIYGLKLLLETKYSSPLSIYENQILNNLESEARD